MQKLLPEIIPANLTQIKMFTELSKTIILRAKLEAKTKAWKILLHKSIQAQKILSAYH